MLIASAAAIFLPIPEARAHATLLSSVPANGSRLDKGPPLVRLLFTEPVDPKLTRLTLTGPNGVDIKLEAAGDPGEVRAIQASLPPLAGGTHRIGWHILSADGHPITGSIRFFVADSTAAAPPMDAHPGGQVEQPAAATPMSATARVASLLRGVSLSALLALCGLLGFSAYGADQSVRQRRICGMLGAAATLALAAHLAMWLVHVSPGQRVDSSIIQAAMSREAGLNELIRLVFTALSASAVLLARRLRIAFAFALAAVIAGGAIGHSAAIEPVIAIPAKALHLVDIAFWFGGLLWLVTSDMTSRDSAQLAGTVSSVATISIAVVTLTGVVQTVLFLGSWRDLVDSLYGIVVLGKISGLLLLAAFGAYHKYKVLPRLTSTDARVLQRSVRREIVLMIVVILIGGILAYAPAPRLS